MILLLYADDLVILADKPCILQSMIMNLDKFWNDCSMTVNLQKSKIMVFRREGSLNRNEKCFFFFFQKSKVDIVNNDISRSKTVTKDFLYRTKENQKRLVFTEVDIQLYIMTV